MDLLFPVLQTLALSTLTIGVISSLAEALRLTPQVPCRPKTLLVITILLHLYLAKATQLLSEPTYVCFYPIEGKTFHHVSESQLVLQWRFQLACAIFVIAALGCKTIPTWWWLFKEQGDIDKLKEPDHKRVRAAEKEVELESTRLRLKYTWRGLLLMALLAGWMGWWIMLGYDRDDAWHW
jgi:hypothetical protein